MATGSGIEDPGIMLIETHTDGRETTGSGIEVVGGGGRMLTGMESTSVGAAEVATETVETP